MRPAPRKRGSRTGYASFSSISSASCSSSAARSTPSSATLPAIHAAARTRPGNRPLHLWAKSGSHESAAIEDGGEGSTRRGNLPVLFEAPTTVSNDALQREQVQKKTQKSCLCYCRRRNRGAKKNLTTSPITMKSGKKLLVCLRRSLGIRQLLSQGSSLCSLRSAFFSALVLLAILATVVVSNIEMSQGLSSFPPRTTTELSPIGLHDFRWRRYSDLDADSHWDPEDNGGHRRRMSKSSSSLARLRGGMREKWKKKRRRRIRRKRRQERKRNAGK